jgi:restriction system protein
MLMGGLIFFLVIGLGFWVFYLHTSRVNQLHNEMSKLGQVVAVHDDVRKILLAGVFQRFRGEEGKSTDTPEEFEKFVAKVLQQYHGGETEIAAERHNGGVDIVHHLNDSVYLGQVVCAAPRQKVGYEPVAVLHSQIVRTRATGGFFISTSSFSAEAVDYAQDVGIELVDGERFLDMWIETVRTTEERIEGELQPST